MARFKTPEVIQDVFNNKFQESIVKTGVPKYSYLAEADKVATDTVGGVSFWSSVVSLFLNILLSFILYF